MRGTARLEAGRDAIDRAGLEAALADPDRPGTVLDLVGDVALIVWLLGSARGEVEAIHGPRLEGLLARLVETPVRAFAYESAGSAGRERLEGGAAIVKLAGARWKIPVGFLDREPDGDWAGWAAATAAQLEALLE